MANAAINNPALRQLSSLSQMHIVRQLGFMALLAASIALGVAVVLWSTGAEYTPLFLNLSTEDSSEVVTALDQSGTPYKIDRNSGMVLVPNDKIQEIRLQLASAGLPQSSSRGYAILEDNQTLGTSNFIEQARYNRALEQELVQTIEHIQGVRSARVHLSIPKQNSFIRSGGAASASVMVDLYHLQSLSNTQLMGIAHLVASSVAGLDTDKVSIVDQSGNLLSRASGGEFNSSSENIRYTREIEENYSNRIIDILTPIVGVGNVRAKVSADLDFTYVETTAETYDPSTSVIRSEQTQEEILGSKEESTAVEPGTLSATPPPDGPRQEVAATNNQSRTNSTRNYEIDRSVSLIRTIPGTINHLSVAVLVNLDNGGDGTAAEAPVSVNEDRLNRLTQLVKDTIGFNEARGDSVNIINEPFIVAEELAPAEAMPVWQQPWIYPAVKLSAAGLVVLLLIFGVLRPAMTTVIAAPGLQKLASPSHGLSDDKVTLTGQMANTALPAAATLIPKSVYDENLQIAQSLVQNEPARAARMIQKWLTNE